MLSSIRMLALILTLLLLSPRAAAEEIIPARWNQLAPHVTGRRVWLPLADGARISGVVQEVTPTGLAMEIAKTSNRKAWPKGAASIPRSSVSTIRLTKPPGHKGLIIGGAVGGGMTAAAGGTLVAIGRNEGGGVEPIVGALVALPLVIGLAVGLLVDALGRRDAKRIVVAPE